MLIVSILIKIFYLNLVIQLFNIAFGLLKRIVLLFILILSQTKLSLPLQN